MQEETNNDLSAIEEQVCKTEKYIFFNGPFSAEHIEESLSTLAAYWRLQSYQQSPSYSDHPSVSEKKGIFNEDLDAVKEKLISPLKIGLTAFVKNFPNDKKGLALLERVKKCEEEISKIRNVIQKF